MCSFDELKIVILLIVSSESKYSNICILALISQNKPPIYSKILSHPVLPSQNLVNKLKFKKYSHNVTITWILYFKNKLIKHGFYMFIEDCWQVPVCVCMYSHACVGIYATYMLVDHKKDLAANKRNHNLNKSYK